MKKGSLLDKNPPFVSRLYTDNYTTLENASIQASGAWQIRIRNYGNGNIIVKTATGTIRIQPIAAFGSILNELVIGGNPLVRRDDEIEFLSFDGDPPAFDVEILYDRVIRNPNYDINSQTDS